MNYIKEEKEMTKFNPLNSFKYFDKIKPEDYIVIMTSKTEDKGLTIELSKPNDIVFEIEYKDNTIVVKDNNYSTKEFVKDVDKSVNDLEEYTNKLIEESLGDN